MSLAQCFRSLRLQVSTFWGPWLLVLSAGCGVDEVSVGEGHCVAGWRTDSKRAGESWSHNSFDTNVSFTFDGKGRVVNELRDITADYTVSTDYEYDDLDRVVVVEEMENERSEYTYDVTGRLEKIESFDIPDGVGDELTYEYLYSYDSLGLLVAVQRTDCRTGSCRTEQRDLYYYDNRLLTRAEYWLIFSDGSSFLNEWADFTYDTHGRLIFEDAAYDQGFMGGGYERTLEYDSAGRLATECYLSQQDTGDFLSCTTYTFDGQGRVTQTVEDDEGFLTRRQFTYSDVTESCLYGNEEDGRPLRWFLFRYYAEELNRFAL